MSLFQYRNSAISWKFSCEHDCLFVIYRHQRREGLPKTKFRVYEISTIEKKKKDKTKTCDIQFVSSLSSNVLCDIDENHIEKSFYQSGLLVVALCKGNYYVDK